MNSASWLEKFKQKNNLSSSKPRKGSLKSLDGGALSPISERQSIAPSSLSRTTSTTAGTVIAKESHNSPGSESIELNDARGPSHSQSSVSLSSAFTDARSPAISNAAISASSPLHSPDLSTTDSGSFFPTQPLYCFPVSATATATQRQRSQTFPTRSTAEQLVSLPPSTTAPTPKSMTTALLYSPIPGMAPAVGTFQPYSPPQQPQPHSHSPPGGAANSDTGDLATPLLSSDSPSPSWDDVHRALEAVMRFFQAQPPGTTITIDPQESMTLGKLMERLRLYGQRRGGVGQHRIPEHEFGHQRSVGAGGIQLLQWCGVEGTREVRSVWRWAVFEYGAEGRSFLPWR